MKKIVLRSQQWLASPACMWAIIGLLIVQAAWLAWCGRYPMAFDEDFHVGVIRLYASHGLPFWSGQPANANTYGAVARDPSYLYHYLMSFPYHLITFASSDLKTQILSLRAINIGLFAASLPLWRRLLLKTGVSRAVAHVCLALFMLIPVVPLLAAQVNYDNLLLLIVPWLLLMVLRLIEGLRRNKTLDVRLLTIVFVVCLLTSLVKYAFLPMFIGIVCSVGWVLARNYSSWRELRTATMRGWSALSRGWRIGLVLLLLLGSGLFFERYGVNTVKYHTPVPDCGQVLSHAACSSYGPWIRDHNFAATNTAYALSPSTYVDDWFRGMWFRLFFAVDGPVTDFQTRGPLTVPAQSAIVFAVASLALVAVLWRRIVSRYNHTAIYLFAAVTSWYVGLLWLDEYKAYHRTGQPVAINGRYLLPILLLVMVVASMGWTVLLRRWPRLKLAAVVIVFGCFAWGGGALTYMLRSNDAWYWSDSSSARTVNHAVQRDLGRYVPGYDKPNQFMR